MLRAIARYLAHVIEDGDYLNDWLTHMPPDVAELMTVIGMFLAAILDS